MFSKSMQCAAFKVLVFTIPLILVAAFHTAAQTQSAAAARLKKTATESNTKEIQIPKDLSANDVDAHLPEADY